KKTAALDADCSIHQRKGPIQGVYTEHLSDPCVKIDHIAASIARGDEIAHASGRPPHEGRVAEHYPWIVRSIEQHPPKSPQRGRFPCIRHDATLAAAVAIERKTGSQYCGDAGHAYPSEETHLDSGALLLLSSPRRGGEGGEALDGNVSNTWQDGGQVVADRNLHPAAALHDRQNRRHLRSGLL